MEEFRVYHCASPACLASYTLAILLCLFVYVFLSPSVSGIRSLVDKNEDKCAEDQCIPV